LVRFCSYFIFCTHYFFFLFPDIFATSEKIKEEDKNDEEYFLGGFSLRYAGRAGKLVNLAELWHYINVRIYPSIGSYKVHVNHVYLGEFENPLMVKENTLLRINDNDD
jgi:hypothetical protein